MPLRDDLLTPISGGNPSGFNLRYDAITDKIQEARREDDDIPQGDWQRVRKLADFSQVVKLAGETLAKKSKDLQLAVWLVDALARREGFVILAPCFEFLRNLVDQFWETLYPELEDGDPELRAAPLDWLGSKLGDVLRTLPIVANGFTYNTYRESRAVGYEAEAAASDTRAQVRRKLIEEGKVSAEEFDAAVDASPKQFYDKLQVQLDDALSSLDSLSTLCDEKFGALAPSFGKVRLAIEEIGQVTRILLNKKGGPETKAEEPVAPLEPEPVVAKPAPAAVSSPAPQPAPAPPAAATAASSTAAVASGRLSPEPADLDDAVARVIAVARFLRAKDEYSISPFLLLRGLRWGELRYNLPQIEQKLLEPPPAEYRTQLKQLFADQKWKELIEIAETAMGLPCGRAWLDLQRYVIKALEARGEWFDQLRSALKSSLRNMLQDIPQLLDMSMTDDTPTANPETRAWIEAEILGAMPEREAPAAVRSDGTSEDEIPPPTPPPERVVEVIRTVTATPLQPLPPPLDEPGVNGPEPDPFDLAVAEAENGRTLDAIGILSRELARERSGRGRFKRRMQIAHVCMAGGQQKIAHPILEELAAEIDSRRLEEWEPGDVLAHPLVLLLRCLDAGSGSAELKSQLYARVCRLDPLQAIRNSR